LIGKVIDLEVTSSDASLVRGELVSRRDGLEDEFIG
jgi:hypothetical protein